MSSTRALSLSMLGASALVAAGGISTALGQHLAGSADALAIAPLVDDVRDYSSAHSVILLAGFAGIAVAFAMAATTLVRERSRSRQNSKLLVREVSELRARHDRYATLIASEPQVIVSWPSRDAEPIIEGDAAIVVPGQQARRVLAFGSWLVPSHAQALEHALNALKNGGERFRLGLRGLDGRYFEADGRAISGQAVFRLRETTVDRQELSRTRDALAGARGDLSALRTMLDAMAQPIWLRDHDGALIWVNHAYAMAVGAMDGAEVIARQIEILDTKSREAVRAAISNGSMFTGRVTVTIAATKLSFEVVESPGGNGTAGMASDVSALETARVDLDRLKDAHARTLDRLPTAVAIFDADKRLVFHNAAYRKLWAIDDAFLASAPGDSELLDRLRSERKLPEQADFRKWKGELLSSYRATAPQDHWWYLPDGRTLHVVVTPNVHGNGAGGVTYVFDDVTERFRLESRYNALMRMQGETLDSLREGVAVFGSDGGLKLSNPAFSDLWQLDDELITSRPHVDVVARHCAALSADSSIWSDIRLAVAGLHDTRTRHTFRVVRLDGAALDCSAAPLPDGSTLLTCTDMTASVSVERALTERNDALEKASRIRDDFVHHVSYELRSPLTSAIGFAQLLAEETVGPLNAKQREYADHITRSSESLLALINDILDLATIDNGGVEMVMGDVDVAEAVAGAIRGIEVRLAEKAVKLRVDVPVDIGTFQGDAKRVRQVLYNLLSNAVSTSHEGGAIIVSAERDTAEIRIAVMDDGSGLTPEQLERLVSRAKATTNVGLSVDVGLSLASSFVELHGGRIEVTSAPGNGTRIVCAFPIMHVLDEIKDKSGKEVAA
ncbi:PAS-domain containing protein [Pseudochelatococcus sp. G4_1912]|uniref:PAS-domain containing protein n=1 Tax=Pseudochelatococcus sp. G4_1912 TaxID=3114288 RepID=UPI0039C67786